jgi:uncharacterized membrane protein
MTAAFLGSLVEFVEALTIVLAVGTVRGWRPALIGAGGGVVALAGLVALAGPSLGSMPITWLQFGVGVLLVLFGMRWLRKAVLRAGGVVALHDEARIYETETATLRRHQRATPVRWDGTAVVTTFKAVVLEGLEIAFIVIAVGASGGMLGAASAGAAAAGLLVLLLGLALHRPLARVPENTLKLAVGILLSAFGVFWVGEGLGVQWPGADFSILGLAVGFLLTALVMVPAVRRSAATTITSPRLSESRPPVRNRLLASAHTVARLFVDDGSLALGTLGWIVLVWISRRLEAIQPEWAAMVLTLGYLALFIENVMRTGPNLGRTDG